MNVLSELYYKTLAKFQHVDMSLYKDDEEYIRLESEGFEQYMQGLQEDNEYLRNKVNLLEARNDKKDFKIKELKNENEVLREANLSMALTHSMLIEKIDELEKQQEIKVDEDYYNTSDLDKKQYSDAIEKITESNDIYKQTINIMCDKYNINHDEVLNIVDDIQATKNNQIEKTL